MARKRYKPEEIVAKLRQVDVLVSQGQGMTEAIRQIGVSEVTYYRWRQEFGGLRGRSAYLRPSQWRHIDLNRALFAQSGGGRVDGSNDTEISPNDRSCRRRM
jgi:transposase-like protein